MIKLYTTHCPQCRALELKLNKKNIEYEVCEDTELMLSKGFKATPMLEVDDKLFNFTEAVKWVNNQ